MTNYHFYLVLNPPPSDEERERIRSLIRLPVRMKDGRTFTMSLLGEPRTVNCVCVTIPESDGNLSQEDSELVMRLAARMISTLRLVYDYECDVVRRGDGFLSYCTITEEDFPNKIDLKLDISINPEYRVNLQQIVSVFAGIEKIQAVAALLAESQLPTLPLQYKYLALYKILEHESAHMGGFSREVGSLIDSYEAAFEELHISTKTLQKFLHHYRAKCAHIYTGNRTRDLGIVGLSSKDAETVASFLPLFRRIVCELLQARHADVGVQFVAPPLGSGH